MVAVLTYLRLPFAVRSPNSYALRLLTCWRGRKMTNLVPRLIRADDFVAETYEKMARQLPPSQKELGNYYLGLAKSFRESGRTGVARVWEEKVEFVKPETPSAKS